MAASPLTAMKMYRKISHDATDRVAYQPGQPEMWAGNPRPITPTYAKLCQARDVPGLDAFSRIQFREDNGKRFHAAADTPVIELMQGCERNWLGTPIPPIPNIFHNLSPAWGSYYDDDDFMTVHETGTNEFQTLLPINFCKKGQNALTPPSGTVVSTSLAATGSATHGTQPMMMLLESTLLGPAAGTDTTGRRFVAYQVQMPTKRNKTDNRKITDNSKITELSETLEIVYEGTYKLLASRVPRPLSTSPSP